MTCREGGQREREREREGGEIEREREREREREGWKERELGGIEENRQKMKKGIESSDIYMYSILYENIMRNYVYR